MFHLKSKPSPPLAVDRVTPGQVVDSSAMVSTPALRAWSASFTSRSSAIASRFSLPP
jgi:hypothetical protein